jgi:regulation of enolase protein 1 (concanavalin A-like superfamily)
MTMQLMNSVQSMKDDPSGIEMIAPGKTDCFIDIFRKSVKFSIPYYFVEHTGDFIARCEVSPELGSMYDAGGLLVFESKKKWIKLAFEKTDLGYPCAVAVVNRDVSDDSNGEKIGESSVWLQVVRKGNHWCLHYSPTGDDWKMVRYFSFKLKGTIKVGLFCQSPTGKGCKAVFKGFDIVKNEYQDIRKAE